MKLSKVDEGTARLEEAAAAYGAALEERTRDEVPLEWAESYGNQGIALVLLAVHSALAANAAVPQIEAANGKPSGSDGLIRARLNLELAVEQIEAGQPDAARQRPGVSSFPGPTGQRRSVPRQ